MNRKSIVITVLLAFVSLTVAAQDTKDAAETSPGLEIQTAYLLLLRLQLHDGILKQKELADSL